MEQISGITQKREFVASRLDHQDLNLKKFSLFTNLTKLIDKNINLCFRD